MRNTPKIIDLSDTFKLPEDAREVVFLKDLNFHPNKMLRMKIAKCAVGMSFYVGANRMIYFKGLKYLIHNISGEYLVYSKGVIPKTLVDLISYKDGRQEFQLKNKTNWFASFPEKFDDKESEEAGKDLYLLQNTEYRSLTPPTFEKVFKNVFQYCEVNEFYEICADLMKFSSDWFSFYETRFSKEPLLKFTTGWGWLYSMNTKMNEQSKKSEINRIYI